MKLFGSTGKKIAKDSNVHQVEITELALVHYNIVENKIQQDSKDFYAFVPISYLVNY